MDETTAAKLYSQAMNGDGPYDVDDIECPQILQPNDTGITTQAISNTTRQTRERTLTNESTSSTESVSKHTLVKLMREQVNLVKTLTNNQLVQKKELKELRDEKARLEEEAAAKQKSSSSTPSPSSRRGGGAPLSSPSTPTCSSRLQLPTNVHRDNSDNQSIVSGLSKYFRGSSSPHKSSHHHRSASTRGRRHPDSKYHTHTTTSSNNNNRHRTYTGESGSPRDEMTYTNEYASKASTLMPSDIVIDPAKVQRTGAFEGERNKYVDYTGPGANQNGGYGGGANNAADRIEITHIPERNVVPDTEDKCISKMWWGFSRICTLLIPDILLCCIGRHARVTKGMSDIQKKEARETRKEAKQAWREKVSIFMIMMFFSACFIGVSGVIPMVLCRETTVFTADEIRARSRVEDWTVIFGTIYDIKEYVNVHPGGEDSMKQFIGKDASKVFPRRPPGRLPSQCINGEKEELASRDPTCDEFDDVDRLVNLQCHTSSVGFRGINKALGEYERGVLAHRPSNLEFDVHTEWLIIYNRVYNVTRYIDSLKDEVTGKIDPESDNAYLNDDLNSLILNKRGQDATAVYEALYDDDVALSCLDDLFYSGVLDEQENMYVSLIVCIWTCVPYLPDVYQLLII